MEWEYLAVPFAAHAKAGENLVQVAAQQFEDLINGKAEQGWEYYRMEHYSVHQAPGCVAAAFGGKSSVVTYDVAVFRRQV